MSAYTKELVETVLLDATVRKVRPGDLTADSARVGVTALLRFLRLPVRYVTIELPLGYSDLEPGDTLYATHDMLPEQTASTAAVEEWRLVPLYVMSVADAIQPPRITVKCLDLREVYCTWWSPLRTEVGMTDDLQGIGIFDQSGGWETVRNQVAFAERPGGDQTFQQVAEDTAILDTDGLLLQGGGDTNLLLNSSFSEGAGDVFTSWTKTTSGAAVAVSWALYTLIDATGYRRACQVATYATGEASNLSQTVNTVDDKLLYVRFWYRNGGTTDPTVIRIQRSSDSKYWRDSDGTWQAGAIDNQVADSSSTASLLWTSKLLDMTGLSTNLTISAGYFSAVYNAGQISQLEGIELLEISAAGQLSDSMRKPLPTKAASVTRVENLTWIINDSAVRVLSPTRGFVKVTVTPLWSHDQLPNTQKKYIWCAEFSADYYFRVYYERIDGGTGQWTFSKWYDNTNAYAYCTVTGGDLPAAGVPTVISARWNSEAYDEHGLPGQAFRIWQNGVAADLVDPLGTPTPTADAVSKVYLGSLPIGSGFAVDSSEYADAHLTNLTIGINCPTDEELARY